MLPLMRTDVLPPARKLVVGDHIVEGSLFDLRALLSETSGAETK